ncbi:MAG: VIT1/CCC1 transporter family protein [Gammaproteobacteria bacterium]|nr:VIT1/CCC1 transporter family protein [Gammaproteobacteria bacterium]
MDVLENWEEEKRSAYLYKIVAASEKDPKYKELFLGLSDMAENQAGIWATQLKKNNITVPAFYTPDWRTKIISQLIRIAGPRRLRLILAATKVRGMSIYRDNKIGHHFPKVFGEEEEQHRGVKHSGNLRAAVFGINDGLLSNTSLILGVAGASANAHFILISGVAGLLAGASSMASGEYISVRSQREMLEYQLALEKHELDTYPEEEAAELALIYEARGLPKDEAVRMSNLLIQNPEKALDTLAREELGVNPDELGSPWGAAISSFTSFVIGAGIPLLPFVISNSQSNLFMSIILSACSLFSVGAILSLFTQRNAWLSGLRVLLIGVAAGTLTYLIGSLFGVATV